MKYDDVYRLKLELLVKDAIAKYKSFAGTIKETFPTGLMRGEKGRFVSGKDIKLLKDQVNLANKLRDTHTQITHQAMTYGQRLGNAVRQAFSLELAFRRISFVMVATFSWKVWYGLLRGLSNVVTSAIKFESVMAKVSTMLEKKTMPLLGRFATEIRRVAVLYGESMKVLGDTLYDVLSARMPPDWAPLVMEEAAKLATAGFTDTKTALKPLLTLMKSYKGTIEDVTKYSNLLTTTVVHGRFTFEELAEQIGKVIPQAAILGISAEKVSAAFAVVTQQLGNAREAATALRRLMLVFAKDNKELNDIAMKYGVTLSDLVDRHDGFAYVMGRLVNATNAEKIAVSGSVRAFSAFASIASDTTGYMAALEDMMGDTYTTQDKLNDVMETAAVKVKQLKASWEDFVLTFQDEILPAVKWVVEMLKADIKNIRRTWDDLFALPIAMSGVFKEEAGKIDKPFAESFAMAQEIIDSWKEAISDATIILGGAKEAWTDAVTAVTESEFKEQFKVLDELRGYGIDVKDDIDKLWDGIIELHKNYLTVALRTGKGVLEAERRLQLWQQKRLEDERIQREEAAEKIEKILTEQEKKEAFVISQRIDAMGKGIEKEIATINERERLNLLLSQKTLKNDERLEKNDERLEKARTNIQQTATNARDLAWEKYNEKVLKDVQKRNELEIKAEKDALSLVLLQYDLKIVGIEEVTAAQVKYIENIKSLGADETEILRAQKRSLSLYKKEWKELLDLGVIEKGTSFIVYLESIKDTIRAVIPNIDELIEKMRKSEEETESIGVKIANSINKLVQNIADAWNSLFQMQKAGIQDRLDDTISALDAQEEAEISYAERIGLKTDKIRDKYDKLRKKAQDKSAADEERRRKAMIPIMVVEALASAYLGFTQTLADETIKPSFLKIPIAAMILAAGLAKAALIGGLKMAKGGLVKIGGNVKAAFGGIIPGTGNKDTVSALLTPGEFVINPKATAQFYPLLKAINEFKTVAVPSITPSLAGGGVVTNNIFDNRLFEEFKEMKEAFLDIGFEEMKDGDYGHFVTKGTKFNRKSVF